MKLNTIPALITLDVHENPNLSKYVTSAINELKRLSVPATFFIPASLLKVNTDIIEIILNDGHQIASHGLYHNKEYFKGLPPERYDQLNENMQRKYLEDANDIFVKFLGNVPTCFRSPSFGISGTTIALLEEFGYTADFSVNSQRLDFLGSNPYRFDNMLAPRLPYHPHYSNPFRPGDSQLWEIPLSSCIFPFAVMTLLTFRLEFFKAFFSVLYKESLSNFKPVVYMCHVEEFDPSANTYTIPIKDLKLKDFLPLKGQGIMARQALRMIDSSNIFKEHINFLEFMTSFDNIQFLTADQYIIEWLNNDESAIKSNLAV